MTNIEINLKISADFAEMRNKQKAESDELRVRYSAETRALRQMQRSEIAALQATHLALWADRRELIVQTDGHAAWADRSRRLALRGRLLRKYDFRSETDEGVREEVHVALKELAASRLKDSYLFNRNKTNLVKFRILQDAFTVLGGSIADIPALTDEAAWKKKLDLVEPTLAEDAEITATYWATSQSDFGIEHHRQSATKEKIVEMAREYFAVRGLTWPSGRPGLDSSGQPPVEGV
jgi:hypothetical protein